MAPLPFSSNMSSMGQVNNSVTDRSDKAGPGSICRSPLGATSRPPLPQQYKFRNGSLPYKMDQPKNGHTVVTSNGMGRLRPGF